MKQLLKNFKQISILLLIISFIGGCTDEDAFLPSIVSNFTHTTTNDSIVSFINISENASNYAWDFGDGSTSTEKNPIKAFTRNGDALQQDFIVALTATNSAGASDVFKDTLTVSFPIIYKAMGLPINFDAVDVDYAEKIVGNVSFEVIDNPELSGVNAEASKVGKITNTGENWENAFFNLDTPVDFTTNKSIKLKLYSTTALPIKLKFEDGTADAVEADVNHGGTGWEELTFDFDSSASYNDMVLFVDGPGTATGTFYIDDLEQVATVAPTTPTAAATAPTREATKVISIFSDAYTDVADTDFNPGWGQTTAYSAETVAEDNIMKYGALNYQGIVLGSSQDVSGMTHLHIDYWTANSTELNAFLISSGDPAVEKEKVLTVPTSGNWTSVDIALTDFDGVDLEDIIQMKFVGNGDVFVDNIYFYTDAEIASCTAETTENIDPANGDIDWTFKTDTNVFESFGNIAGTIEANPDFSGINTSCNVQKVVKTNGCETWSGVGKEIPTALDFTNSSTKKVFKLKVLAETQIADVTLRLERLPHPDTDPAIERVASVTQSGIWQELTFDFSDVSTGTYKSVIIYFERNATCDGDVYYFDDLMQVAGGSGGTTACTAETTENIDPANGDIDWTFKTDTNVFESFGNIAGTIEANPDFSGINTSCNVQKVVKTNGCETWSGVGTEIPTALDFTNSSTNKVFKLKVLAETQVADVTLRLERLPHPDVDPAIERVASVTQSGIWQELTFDFSDVSTGTYKSVIIYFERNATCDGDVYYFDDLIQVSGGSGGTTGGTTTCPAAPTGELLSNGDFEAGNVCWQFFDGATLSTTVNNGGSNSGELPGVANVAVRAKMERFAVGSVLPNTSYTVTFDIKASEALSAGSVLKAFAFSEGAEGGTVAATQHILTDNTTSVATTWEMKTYTFTTPANANQVEGGLSFLIELVNSTSTVNIDNVVIKKTP